MIDANTIVGDPITTDDGITLIPVSKVSFGFAGGGTDFPQKHDNKNGFGGGTGAGVNITPVAFLVVKEKNVSVIYVTPTALTTVDRIIETVPGVIDKVTEFLGKENEEKV
jgi:sporulation protein YtfJ